MNRPIVQPPPPYSRRAAPVVAVVKAKKSWQSRLAGSPVLLFSILIHILLAGLTFFFIVQRVKENRKITFAEVSPASGSPAQQLQHKIELTKKKNTMSVPDVTQRISTTGLSDIVLPEVTLPSEVSTADSTGKMEGTAISSANAGQGSGMGLGMGMGQGQDMSVDVSAIAATSFGLSNGKGLGLVGHFYDLKQTSNRMPTGMDVLKYAQIVGDFANTGWKDDYFKGYFMSPSPLYLPQMFTPYMTANLGPKAFHVEHDVQPRMWVVVYHGKIVLPKGGSYRFVGFGDDACVVALNHKTIFDGSWRGPQSQGINHPPTGTYVYNFPTSLSFGNFKTKFMCGDWISFNEGQPYDIQILVGERPGGYCGFWLMVQQQYREYAKTPEGSPILPLFKLSNAKMPPVDIGCPPYDKDEDLGWRVVDDGDNSTDDPTSNP